MIQNNTGLALKNLVADEGILVALTFVGVGVRLQDDVIDELLDASIVEEASHRLRWVDESGLDVFFVENILEGEVFPIEKAIKILRVVKTAIQT